MGVYFKDATFERVHVGYVTFDKPQYATRVHAEFSARRRRVESRDAWFLGKGFYFRLEGSVRAPLSETWT